MLEPIPCLVWNPQSFSLLSWDKDYHLGQMTIPLNFVCVKDTDLMSVHCRIPFLINGEHWALPKSKWSHLNWTPSRGVCLCREPDTLDWQRGLPARQMSLGIIAIVAEILLIWCTTSFIRKKWCLICRQNTLPNVNNTCLVVPLDSCLDDAEIFNSLGDTGITKSFSLTYHLL